MSTAAEVLISTTRVANSLVRTRINSDNLAVALDNAQAVVTGPVNSEITVLDDLAGLTNDRATSLVPEPYWLNQIRYSASEVLLTTVEFLDRHQAPLPLTTLPPEKDVQGFIRSILDSDHKVDLRQQFKTLLDFSAGNIIGAANLGFIASRLLARGWDTRAYPQIKITPEIVRLAGQKIAQFEKPADEPSDGPGDTYYFWTHFFAASVYHQLSGRHAQTLNQLYAAGTPIMRFVRKYLAGQPTIGNHREASLLGRHVGLAICQLKD